MLNQAVYTIFSPTQLSKLKRGYQKLQLKQQKESHGGPKTKEGDRSEVTRLNEKIEVQSKSV